MKKSMRLGAVMLLTLFTAAGQQKSAGPPMVIHTRADAVQAMDQIQSDLAQLNTSHQNYREAAEKLATLYTDLSKKAEAVAVAARAVRPERPDPKAVSQWLTATTDARNADELQPAISAAPELDAEREPTVHYGQQHHEDQA